MRNPARIFPLLTQVSIFWYKHPDLRFFQMIEALRAQIDPNSDPFNWEDDATLLELKELNNT